VAPWHFRVLIVERSGWRWAQEPLIPFHDGVVQGTVERVGVQIVKVDHLSVSPSDDRVFVFKVTFEEVAVDRINGVILSVDGDESTVNPSVLEVVMPAVDSLADDAPYVKFPGLFATHGLVLATR
jgi:hypothetical protein